jgi:uncharacterized protein YjaG (DUF416 family)
MMNPEQAYALYLTALNSGIPAVEDFIMTAMQNAVDQCGKLTEEFSEAHSEVFVSTIKSQLDLSNVDDTILRWFATREMRSCTH